MVWTQGIPWEVYKDSLILKYPPTIITLISKCRSFALIYPLIELVILTRPYIIAYNCSLTRTSFEVLPLLITSLVYSTSQLSILLLIPNCVVNKELFFVLVGLHLADWTNSFYWWTHLYRLFLVDEVTNLPNNNRS